MKKDTNVLFENSWVILDSSPKLFNFKFNLIGSKGAIYIDISHNKSVEKLTQRYVYPDTTYCYDSD